MKNQSTVTLSHPIKIIVGLGNPGPAHFYQRHTIGFRVVNALADAYHGVWHHKNNMYVCDITIQDKKITLIKPQTFMNSSGAVVSPLLKKGIEAANILVVHDELEKPFGSLTFKIDGSHKGHNGLRSIIAVCGPAFVRLRFGIGRPTDKSKVPDYVLENFSEDKTSVQEYIDKAVTMIEEILTTH